MIALLTFAVGVTLVTLWLVKWRHSVSTPATKSITEAKFVTPGTTVPSDATDEYEVYSSLLGKRTKKVLIEDQTMGYPSDQSKAQIAAHEEWLAEYMPGLQQNTVTDYISKNKDSHHLENLFKLKVETLLVSPSEIKKVYEKHAGVPWQISDEYPGSEGVFTFSSVGFNSERTQALVHMGISCGWLCGEGNFYLLAKENGVWKVQKKIMTWIS